MNTIPTAAIVRHKLRIAAKIAAAVAALRVADEKLVEVVITAGPDASNAWEIVVNVRTFANFLDNETAALPPRIDATGIEGAVAALRRAEESLTAALDLAGQFDGRGIDPEYHLAYIARNVIRSYFAILAAAAGIAIDETPGLAA